MTPTQSGQALIKARLSAEHAARAYQAHYLSGVRHASSAREPRDIVEVNNLRVEARRAWVALLEAEQHHALVCRRH